MFLLIGAAVPFAAQRFDGLPVWVSWVLSATLVATGVATFVALATKRLLAAALLPAAGVAVGFVFVVTAVFPMADTFKSGREFAEVIREATAESRAAGNPVLAFGIGNLPDSYSFYSNGVYFVKTNDVADLAAHLDQRARVLAVVRSANLKELADQLGRRLEIVATTGDTPRDVALIANRPE
jgi:hypothetical protein